MFILKYLNVYIFKHSLAQRVFFIEDCHILKWKTVFWQVLLIAIGKKE